MGYKIGVPSLKLNNVGNKSKHCGSFGGVAYEGLEERKGLDNDINPEMSQYNIYTGYRSAAELMEYSERHLKELKDASGRGIRKDAVVMCATIFKPPAVYMNSLSVEDQQRLLGDCLEFIKPVVGTDNVKAAAQHFDEKGAHLHVFWEPMTADGRLCAKELHNIKFFGYINEHLPAYLRERGWEIDDADCYDRAQREREDIEAEEERYQKRQQQGRSSAAYKLEAEQQRLELQRENEQLSTKNSRLAGTVGLMEIKQAQLEDESRSLTEQNENLRQQGAKIFAAISTLSELKTETEYHAKAAKNAEDLESIRAGAENMFAFTKKWRLPIDAAKELLETFFAAWKDVITRLQNGIQQLKVFEAMHKKLFGPGKLEPVSEHQERSLQDILDNAFDRSGAVSEGAHNHELEETQGKA